MVFGSVFSTGSSIFYGFLNAFRTRHFERVDSKGLKGFSKVSSMVLGLFYGVLYFLRTRCESMKHQNLSKSQLFHHC